MTNTNLPDTLIEDISSAEDTCKTCLFWKRGFRDYDTVESELFPWVDKDRVTGKPIVIGQCRIGPSYTPRHEDDWCGEYKENVTNKGVRLP